MKFARIGGWVGAGAGASAKNIFLKIDLGLWISRGLKALDRQDLTG